MATADAAPAARARSRALLFRPFPIGRGGLTLPNRIWLPAMVTWRGTEDGYVTDSVREVYRRYAQGGAGMIVLEATGIRDVRSGPLLRLSHDRFVPGLRALREEMHSRRQLLLQLLELLEPRHLALVLRSYGDAHNSVRERIWLGYHDRLHAADVRRARRMHWHPPKLEFDPRVRPAVDALSPDETLYVIYSVDPTKWELPSVVPGWSNRNLLAHIATGDWVFQSHLRHVIETGEVAEWPHVDVGNAERLEERKFTPVATLVDEYLSMRHETMLMLAQLNPARLAPPIRLWWFPEGQQERTIVDYVLAFERHERSHCDQLRPVMRWATSLR